MKTYTVHLVATYDFSDDITVEAPDEEEAIYAAKELFECDWSKGSLVRMECAATVKSQPSSFDAGVDECLQRLEDARDACPDEDVDPDEYHAAIEQAIQAVKALKVKP